METDDLITPEQAAAALQITRQSVYDAIKAETLPAVKVLGRWAVKRSGLADYQPRGYRDRPGRPTGGRPRKTATETIEEGTREP